MGSALVVVGLAVVLSLQVAIHLRLARMGSLVRAHRAQLATAEQRAEQAEAQLAEAPAVVTQLRGAAAEQREIVGNLQVLLGTWTEIVCTLAAEANEANTRHAAAVTGAPAPEPLRVPERRPPPVPRGAMPPAPTEDEHASMLPPPVANRGAET